MTGWAPIPGWEGAFEVRADGVIRSLDRQVRNIRGFRMVYGKIMPERINHNGYRTVSVSHRGKSSSISVHRALALAFIPNQEGKAQVNHKDGNKLNCSLDNLEWTTPSENVRHAFSIGLRRTSFACGSDCYAAKLTETDVHNIRRCYQAGGVTMAKLATHYGVHTNTVWKVVNRIKWRHLKD